MSHKEWRKELVRMYARYSPEPLSARLRWMLDQLPAIHAEPESPKPTPTPKPDPYPQGEPMSASNPDESIDEMEFIDEMAALTEAMWPIQAASMAALDDRDPDDPKENP